MTPIALQYLILTSTLILWCFIHSAMIAIPVVESAKKKFGSFFRFYRLFYNLVAVLTLIPIYTLMRSTPAVSCIVWSGPWRFLQVLLDVAGLFLLFAGARNYDGMQFLGLRQIFSAKHDIGLSESGGLHTAGILNVTRHPWYLAGLLVLWARDIDSVSLIVNVIFSLYLIIGAKIEEKKLMREFRDDYADYQSRVSMFVPWKWLLAYFRK